MGTSTGCWGGSERVTSAKDRMRDEVLEGRPVSAFEIVDAHGHLGYWHNFGIPQRTAEDMVRQMDRAGIRCCIASSHASISADYRLGNDQMLRAMREFPGRIFGYCGVNPNYLAAELRDELSRCMEAGMAGIKLHPLMHAHRADGEGYRPAWEFAQEHGLCVLSHTAAGEQWDLPVLFDRLAADYPNAKILMGHSGFGYEGGEQCCELARKHPNVYLEIAGSIPYLGLVERLVVGAGADRVVFGTDLPFIDCRPQVGRLAFSGLNDDQLELVLGGNARRIFGL